MAADPIDSKRANSDLKQRLSTNEVVAPRTLTAKSSDDPHSTVIAKHRLNEFLQAELISFKFHDESKVFAAIRITHIGNTGTVAVAANELRLKDDDYVSAKVVDHHGNSIRATEVSGLPLMRTKYGQFGFGSKSGLDEILRVVSAEEVDLLGQPRYGWVGRMKEMKPGETVTYTLSFLHKGASKEGQLLARGDSFELQCDLIRVNKVSGSDKPEPALDGIYFKFANIPVPAAGTFSK